MGEAERKVIKVTILDEIGLWTFSVAIYNSECLAAIYNEEWGIKEELLPTSRFCALLPRATGPVPFSPRTHRFSARGHTER